MMRKSARFFTVLFNVIFSFVLFFFVLNAVLFGLCFPAGTMLPLPEYQILRVNVLSKSQSFSGSSVSARIAILDMQGNDCAVIERSWNGDYLYLTFRTAEFNGKTFFFPEKIYGSESAVLKKSFGSHKRGTNLLSYYLENNQCFLTGNRSSYLHRKNMFILARFAFSPMAAVASGFSSRYTVNLSECEPGKDYGVFTGSEDGLVLRLQ